MSDPWKRTRQLQVAVVRSTLFLIVLLTGALLVVITGPVRRALEYRDRDEFTARAELIGNRAWGFFQQSEQLVRQIPSRTRMRQDLVAYHEGRMTLEELRRSSGPKYADAVTASSDIVGAIRFGLDRDVLLSVHFNPSDVPQICLDSSTPTLLPFAGDLDGGPVAFFCVPIHHPGFGLAGYDLVAVSLASLQHGIDTRDHAHDAPAVGIFESRAPDLQNPVLASTGTPWPFDQPGIGNPFELDGATISTIDGYLLFGQDITDGWRVAVVQERSALYGRARSDILVFGGSVLLLSLIAAAAAVLVLGVLSRRTLAETEALNRIVEDQTAELRLTLKEVHHRVKNDIYLTNSFLEIRAMASPSEDVRSALMEATASLRLMGELYDLMHQSGDIRTVDLKTLVDKVVNRIAGPVGGCMTVRTEVDEGRIKRSMARPMAMIVNELMTNVVKYRGDDDRRTVDMSVVFLDEGAVDVTIQDDGPGFPDSVLNGDYGFGLEMAGTMASRFGGSLKLENVPGARATVRLRRPDRSGTPSQEPASGSG